MSCLLTEVQLRPRRRLSPDCYCTVVNYKTGFIFLSGGGGVVFLGSRRLGAHLPCHLIFTLFQSNVYKVNVRLLPCGFMSRKRTTFDVMMV